MTVDNGHDLLYVDDQEQQERWWISEKFPEMNRNHDLVMKTKLKLCFLKLKFLEVYF